MIVDLDERPPERGRFDIEGGGWVELTLLPQSALEAIDKECTTTRVEYPILDGQYRRFEAVKTDNDRKLAMTLDRCIVSFGDITDRSGKPVAVNSENKKLLFEKVPLFKATVDAGLKTLREREAIQAAEREKNLLSG